MADFHIWPISGIDNLELDAEDLGSSEIPGIKAVWADLKKRYEGSAQLLEFMERFSREWAIETGIIENLYDINRGVTKTLIEHGFHSEFLSHGSTNKPREFVISLIRDHKDALDGICSFVKSERPLTVSYIKELHASLLRSQDTTEALDDQGNLMEVKLIKGDWKVQPNFPVKNGDTIHYCPPEQTASEMDRLIAFHDGQIEQGLACEVRAAWLHHRFTQIHPFQDGNGRIARALASLVLIKDGLFPMVITRDDRQGYIQALETADKGDLNSLINLIVSCQRVQFFKANSITDFMQVDDNVQTALEQLDRAVGRQAVNRLTELRRVIDLAHQLTGKLKKRLEQIKPDVQSSLNKLHEQANVSVTESNSETDLWFQRQIIENAKNHLGYHADTSEHQSWVALVMNWSRLARLVFTFHGLGKPFNGSLICTSFLEFKDRDDENNTQTSIVPLAEEGFVFFYNEQEEKLVKRFEPWLERVLAIALQELALNI